MTGIIIAAAGRGERFLQAGGTGNKLNAQFQQNTVFAVTLSHALNSGLPVHVVTRPDNTGVQKICQQQQVPFTLLASAGLGESIAAGVAATSGWHGWLIQLADMPHVPPEMFREVAQALADHTIVRPVYQQQPGHPVGFSAACRSDLLTLQGDEGARALLKHHSVYPLNTNLAGVIQDIDLPSQLTAEP